MQRIILVTTVLFFSSALCQLRAQSFNNTSWKTYIGAPINDTAIFTIYRDSSVITNAKGEVMVRHQCKITGDTLTIIDIGPEEQGCPDMKGSYQINRDANSFTLTVINDACEGRPQALTGRKWIEAKK